MAYLRYGLNTIFNNYNVVFGHWSLFYEENTALHIWVTLDGDSLSWDCCGQKLLVLLNLGTPWKKKAFVCVVSAVGRDYKGEGINLNGIGGLFFLIYQKKKKKALKLVRGDLDSRDFWVWFSSLWTNGGIPEPGIVMSVLLCHLVSSWESYF